MEEKVGIMGCFENMTAGVMHGQMCKVQLSHLTNLFIKRTAQYVTETREEEETGQQVGTKWAIICDQYR